MDLGLDRKACIVTGATRGIGPATTRTLIEEGARVLATRRSRHRRRGSRSGASPSRREIAAVIAAWSAEGGTVASII